MIYRTERTYVQGLQELIDIYVKPAAIPVNILSSVGTAKDTTVPASERKIVFGGLDALFSFHKDSFQPALEFAAAPLMKSAAELQETDTDGQLSIKVAKDVGNMFLKHAAFMKMYSTYIKLVISFRNERGTNKFLQQLRQLCTADQILVV